MSTQAKTIPELSAALQTALAKGDLNNLKDEQKTEYYNAVCESVGLNPLTQPFAYQAFQGKTVLYARKDATEQLRKLYDVSILNMRNQMLDDIFIVTVDVRAGNRYDSSTGAVAVKGLTGQDRANAFMKAETKAKRRGTLSICGLGILDESEIADISEAPALPPPVFSPAATPTMDKTPAPEGESRPEKPAEVPANATPASQANENQAPAPSGVPKAAIPADTKQLEIPSTPAESTTSEPKNVANNVAKPTKSQFDTFTSRAVALKQPLERAGLKPSKGFQTGAKLKNYLLSTVGVKELTDLTIGQWETFFADFEPLVKSDAAAAVKRIEDAK